jgi:hypothetical protein
MLEARGAGISTTPNAIKLRGWAASDRTGIAGVLGGHLDLWVDLWGELDGSR